MSVTVVGWLDGWVNIFCRVREVPVESARRGRPQREQRQSERPWRWRRSSVCSRKCTPASPWPPARLPPPSPSVGRQTSHNKQHVTKVILVSVTEIIEERSYNTVWYKQQVKMVWWMSLAAWLKPRFRAYNLLTFDLWHCVPTTTPSSVLTTVNGSMLDHSVISTRLTSTNTPTTANRFLSRRF